MLVPDFRKTPGGIGKSVFPRCRFEFSRGAVADQGRRKSTRRLYEIKARKTTLHAEQSVVRGPVGGFGTDDAAVFHQKVVLTPRRAVRARGEDFLNFPTAPVAAEFFGERSRRAGRGTIAAGFAARGFPIRSERRLNRKTGPGLLQVQDAVSGAFGAGTHTALAAHAERGVIFKKGVRVFDGAVGGRRIDGRRVNSHFAAKILQFAASVFNAGKTLESVLRNNEFERRFAGGENARRIRRDVHAVRDRGRAGRDEPFNAFDFHKAEAAGSDAANVFKPTEGRDTDVGLACRFENRRTRFARKRRAVDGEIKHTELSQRPCCRSRSSHIADNGGILDGLLRRSCRLRCLQNHVF